MKVGATRIAQRDFIERKENTGQPCKQSYWRLRVFKLPNFRLELSASNSGGTA